MPGETLPPEAPDPTDEDLEDIGDLDDLSELEDLDDEYDDFSADDERRRGCGRAGLVRPARTARSWITTELLRPRT